MAARPAARAARSAPRWRRARPTPTAPGAAPSSAPASAARRPAPRCAGLPIAAVDLHVERRGRRLAPLQELGGEEPLHVARHLQRAEPLVAEGEALQRLRHLVRAGEAGVAPLAQRAHHHRVQLRRHVGHLRRARDRIVEDRAHRGQLGLAAEEPPAGQHLPEHDAQREHVGPVVDLLGRRLLGRHVFDLPLEAAGAGVRDAAERARDAEVDQLHRPLEREQHVLRRDVAVHDAQRAPVAVGERVRVAEAARRLRDDVGRQRGAGRALLARGLAQHRRERLALHQLHGQEVLLAVVADLDDADDVRVIEQRRQPRLVEEHPDELPVRGEVREDPLDDQQRPVPRQLARQRQIDLRHPAGREASDYLKAPQAPDRVVHPRVARAARPGGYRRAYQRSSSSFKSTSFDRVGSSCARGQLSAFLADKGRRPHTLGDTAPVDRGRPRARMAAPAKPAYNRCFFREIDCEHAELIDVCLAGLLGSDWRVGPRLGCAGVKPSQPPSGSGGSSSHRRGGATGSGGVDGSGGTVDHARPVATASAPTSSRPPTTRTRSSSRGSPADVTGMFGTPSGNGPCVTEPEDGSLFPNNWLPPRVHVARHTPARLPQDHLPRRHGVDGSRRLRRRATAGRCRSRSGRAWRRTSSSSDDHGDRADAGRRRDERQLPDRAGRRRRQHGLLVGRSEAVGKPERRRLQRPGDVIVNDSYLDGFTVGDISTVGRRTASRPEITDVSSTVDQQGGTTQRLALHRLPRRDARRQLRRVRRLLALVGGVRQNLADATPRGRRSRTNWITWAPTCTKLEHLHAARADLHPVPVGRAGWRSPRRTGRRGTASGSRSWPRQLPTSDPSTPWNTDNYDAGQPDLDRHQRRPPITDEQRPAVPDAGDGFGLHAAHRRSRRRGVPDLEQRRQHDRLRLDRRAGHRLAAAPAIRTAGSTRALTDLYPSPTTTRRAARRRRCRARPARRSRSTTRPSRPTTAMIAYTAVPSGQVMYANAQAELYVVPFGGAGRRSRRA